MNNPQTIARALELFASARALHGAGRLAEAAEAYRRATQLLPNHVDMLAGYARLAQDVSDWPAAEKLYRRIGELRPDGGHEGHLAFVLLQQGRNADAAHYFRAARARSPTDMPALRGLAMALGRSQQWQEALDCGLALERSVPASQQTPDVVLNSLFYLGMGDELDARIDTVLPRYPGNHAIAAICGLHLLKRGDFRRGFRLLRDAGWGLPGGAADAAGAWRGETFDGTLLVIGEQGLGEEILASSLFGTLPAARPQVRILCEPRLAGLFRRSFPGLQVVPGKEISAATAADAEQPVRHIKSLDLAALSDNPLPARPAWLTPDPERAARLKQELRARWPGKRLVGLSWSSSRAIHGARDKSAPLSALAPLLSMPDTVCINLQYGDTTADLAQLAGTGLPQPNTVAGIDNREDIDGLLALMSALDAIVTVSNTTAHLAGAAGLECHLLLPHAHPVFWYWGYRGEHTPWYPAMRIWRCDPDGSWSGLAGKVARQLLQENA